MVSSVFCCSSVARFKARLAFSMNCVRFSLFPSNCGIKSAKTLIGSLMDPSVTTGVGTTGVACRELVGVVGGCCGCWLTILKTNICTFTYTKSKNIPVKEFTFFFANKARRGHGFEKKEKELKRRIFSFFLFFIFNILTSDTKFCYGFQENWKG